MLLAPLRSRRSPARLLDGRVTLRGVYPDGIGGSGALAFQAPQDKPLLNIVWNAFGDNAWQPGNLASLNIGGVRNTTPFNGADGTAGDTRLGIPEVAISAVRRSTASVNRIAFDHQPMSAVIQAGETVYLSRSDFSETALSYGGFTITPKQAYTVASSSGTAITIDMGSTVTDDGTVPLTGWRLWHPRFERIAGTPRAMHANQALRVNEVIADGGYVLLGGDHHTVSSAQDLWDLVRRYGFAPVQTWLTGWFQWIAARGWSPSRVAVCITANELIQWTSNPVGGVTPRQWVRDWLLPTARAILPSHTLAMNFGGGFNGYNSYMAAAAYDLGFVGNRVVIINSYPGVDAGAWDDEPEHIAAWAALKAKALTDGFNTYFGGEFGVLKSVADADRTNRYRWAFEQAQANGAWCAYWAGRVAYNDPATATEHPVAGLGTDAVWSPATAMGFWGPRYGVDGVFGLAPPALSIALSAPVAGDYDVGVPITVSGTSTGPVGDIEWSLFSSTNVQIGSWAVLDTTTDQAFSGSISPSAQANVKVRVRKAAFPTVTADSPLFNVVSPASFTPPSLPAFSLGGGVAGVWAHLEAQDTATVLNSSAAAMTPNNPNGSEAGGFVETWQDKSANARHFTEQASGAERRPGYNDRIAGPGHGIRLGGPRAAWSSTEPRETGLSSTATLDIGGTASLTIFVVATLRMRNWTANSGFGTLIGRGTSTGRLLTVGHSATATDSNHVVRPYGTGGLQDIETGLGDANWARTRIYTLRQTGANARVYLDGVQVGSDFAHGQAAVNQRLTIGNDGGYGVAVGNGAAAWFHEVLVWNSSLSDGDMATVHAYLTNRWADRGARVVAALAGLGQSNMGRRLDTAGGRSFREVLCEGVRRHLGAAEIRSVGSVGTTAHGSTAMTRSASGNYFINDHSPEGTVNADPATWSLSALGTAALTEMQAHEARIAIGQASRIQGVVWCQGEEDVYGYTASSGRPWHDAAHPLFGASIAARKAWYKDGAKRLMALIRAGMGRSATELPWYVLTIGREGNGSSSPWNAEVASAIRTAWAEIAAESGNPHNVVVAQPNALGAAMEDSVHISPAGYIQMDIQAARAVAAHMIGRGLDDVFPAIGYSGFPVASAIEAASGTTIDITVTPGDGGTDISVPVPTSLAAWRVVDASGARTVTSASRLDANTVRLQVSGAALSNPVTVWLGWGGVGFGGTAAPRDNAALVATESGFGGQLVDMPIAVTRHDAPLVWPIVASADWELSDGSGAWELSDGSGAWQLSA